MATRVTVVDGSTYTGLYAADGSINVRVVTPTTPIGVFAPCGAYNVVMNFSQEVYHSSGAYNASDEGGGFYAFGPFKADNIKSGETAAFTYAGEPFAYNGALFTNGAL